MAASVDARARAGSGGSLRRNAAVGKHRRVQEGSVAECKGRGILLQHALSIEQVKLIVGFILQKWVDVIVTWQRSDSMKVLVSQSR